MAARRDGAEPARQLAPVPLAPAWGWKIPDAGRAAHVSAGPEYQATTTQLCGLFPFVAGSGTPTAGTPIGRHQLWGEVVCLDPLAWLRAGLVTNPGVFVLGQPGTGKSALVKRLVTGAVAFGTQALILGDTKPDYTPLVRHLGGQVIRIGRGLDRINPLDAGPLGAALRRMTGPDAQQLWWEVRSRRLALLMALATLIRGERISNAEEVVLGRAIDLLDERNHRQMEPTVADVLAVIEEGPDMLRSAARADTLHRYTDRVADLVFTMDLLCTGSLAGVFDGHTSQPIAWMPPPSAWTSPPSGRPGTSCSPPPCCAPGATASGVSMPPAPSPASAQYPDAPTSASWTNCGAPCAAPRAWSSTRTCSPA
jgi:hypothetical protein